MLWPWSSEPQEVSVSRWVVRGVALTAVLGMFGSAPAPAASSLPTRWILVYAGGRGRPAYTVDQFRKMVSSLDSAGNSVGWLMTGALFIEIRAASGRGLATWAIQPPANGSDWEGYLDSLLNPGGAVARLDSAVSIVESKVGPLAQPYPVVIMTPYPDPAGKPLQFGGVSYDLSTGAGRLGLEEAYLAGLRARWARRHFAHVSLYGLYWLNETVPTSADRAFLPRLATAVHQSGLKFLWIPYYKSSGYSAWRSLGFDEAWYQPNFFFHPGVSMLRVDSAMHAADSLGMGIEIEFDGRVLTTSPFADRLTPYLVTLWLHPTLMARPVTVYDGGGGLFELAGSKDPRLRALYRDLVAVLTANPDTVRAR